MGASNPNVSFHSFIRFQQELKCGKSALTIVEGLL